MDYILVIGTALNFSGSAKFLIESLQLLKTKDHHEEYLQLKLFVVGAASTFGAIYLYLYFNPQYIWPVLIFGAFLKAWAFLSCLFLYRGELIATKRFFEFGISNGIVSVLFLMLLIDASSN